MMQKNLPLEEKSINEIYNTSDIITYSIPIYQRNYAWDKEQIEELVKDVYDTFDSNTNSVYYIGTLVSYDRGEKVFEVIDGQQRLTTIFLILNALGIKPTNKLSYRARPKSAYTIKKILEIEENRNIISSLSDMKNKGELDLGIKSGIDNAIRLIEDIVGKRKKEFTLFFLHNVHIIHYTVPKDIDLNHYFEVMNSRGEQLEKHEIEKAKLLAILKNESERKAFAEQWEACSKMNIYLQQAWECDKESVFGRDYHTLLASNFLDLVANNDINVVERKSIIELIKLGVNEQAKLKEKDVPESFQNIIDFPNFLLIVLKLTRFQREKNFNVNSFSLDDKELLNEFNKVDLDENFVKEFGYNLFKAKFLLDNYIVHHSNEEETSDNNPWKLQCYHKEANSSKAYLRNLFEREERNSGANDETYKRKQMKLVHLMSMFEVTFTPKQRKNYLFYCLLYLFNNDIKDIDKYLSFVEALADKYFYDIYLNSNELSENNSPKPSAFDSQLIVDNALCLEVNLGKDNFSKIYGDIRHRSRGISLFVFNYLDFKIWDKYADELKGEGTRTSSEVRKNFFSSLGCRDFGLDIFKQFYFSRTRRSLEHYYPQANINDEIKEDTINCFGNYAMIGSEANSSGSNWSPKGKLQLYLDSSQKIPKISVASLKFMIMMQVCKDNIADEVRKEGKEWSADDIEKHQQKMLTILGCK